MSDGRLIGVTGASGFVGRALLERAPASRTVSLLRKGDDLNSHRRQIGDLVIGKVSQDALSGLECIIHLAGRAHVPQSKSSSGVCDFQRTNVSGSLRLAESAARAGVRRLVFVSSIGVHGLCSESKPFTSEDTPAPYDAYSRSKLDAELALLEVSERTGLEIFIVRPPLVYGPRPVGNFARLVQLVNSGIPLPFGAVKNRRSFVSTHNLSDFLLHCASTRVSNGGTFLVSDDEIVSTPQLLRTLAEALGKNVRMANVPSRVLRAGFTAIGRRADYDRLCSSLEMDIRRTKEALGWNPPFTMRECLFDSFLRKTFGRDVTD